MSRKNHSHRARNWSGMIRQAERQLQSAEYPPLAKAREPLNPHPGLSAPSQPGSMVGQGHESRQPGQ